MRVNTIALIDYLTGNILSTEENFLTRRDFSTQLKIDVHVMIELPIKNNVSMNGVSNQSSFPTDGLNITIEEKQYPCHIMLVTMSIQHVN